MNKATTSEDTERKRIDILFGKQYKIRHSIMEDERRHAIDKSTCSEKVINKNRSGMLKWMSKVRAVSTSCQCYLSTTPFYCGVQAHDDWCKIPCEVKNRIENVRTGNQREKNAKNLFYWCKIVSNVLRSLERSHWYERELEFLNSPILTNKRQRHLSL